MDASLNTKHIAFLGDYVPRRCGIATFTADICEAIATEFPDAQCIVGSVNDRAEGYDYPERVRFDVIAITGGGIEHLRDAFPAL